MVCSSRICSNKSQQLDLDMAADMHKLMPPSKLKDLRVVYKDFSKKRFSKRIDQKKEAAKPYGVNPMQQAARRKKKEQVAIKHRPNISRIDNTTAYIN